MKQIIQNFAQQFSYKPEIQNKAGLKNFGKFVILGMGGSNLAANLVKMRDPYFDIITHRDYGLPKLPDGELAERLFIASSYSGNTAETIDTAKAALAKKLPIAVITTGGQLLKLAKDNDLPYIQMPPEPEIPPRQALGYSLMALLEITGRKNLLNEAALLANELKPQAWEQAGREMAQRMKGFIPIFYASASNEALARIWKIKFNETGKVPAFYNVFPELNHNEMASFDSNEATKDLVKKFYCFFLADPQDSRLIAKRMSLTEQIYQEQGLATQTIILEPSSAFYKIFTSIILADWAAYYTATGYGADPTALPLVEKFKKLI